MRKSWSLSVMVLILTGCGSTVQVAGTAQPSDGFDGNAGQPKVLSPGSPGSSSSTSGTMPTVPSSSGVAAGSGASAAPGGASFPDGSGSGATTVTASGRSAGHGYDAASVRIGIVTETDASKAASGLGVSNLDFGDQVGQTKAVIADINAHGGVLGRKLVPVYVDMSTAEVNSNPSAAAARACTALTQDAKVISVLNLVAGVDIPSFYACLKAAGTPGVSGGLRATSEQALRKLDPYKYTLATPAYSVLAPLFVRRLKATGYFTGWDTTRGAPGSAPVKVGVVYGDDPEDKAAEAALQSALAQQGIAVAATYAYDASSASAAISSQGNAVLPFRSKGVTHVIHLDNTVAFLMEAAESQSYRPRYGLTSISAPATLLQSNAPAAQLAGSLGIGWLPVGDVDDAHSPAVSAGAARCDRVMKASGQKYTGAARLTSAEFCDGIYLVAAAAESSGRLDPQGLRGGTVRLGSSFTTASAFASGFTAGRPSMPGVARDLGWDANQKAFRYLSTTSYSW